MNAREMPTPDADTSIATLANGVRVVAIELPHLASACVSVFVSSVHVAVASEIGPRVSR